MAKEVERSCKTCIHLDAYTSKGQRRVMPNQNYKCKAPLPALEDINLPDSVKVSHYFRDVLRSASKGGGGGISRMKGRDGAECQAWEQYTKAGEAHVSGNNDTSQAAESKEGVQ